MYGASLYFFRWKFSGFSGLCYICNVIRILSIFSNPSGCEVMAEVFVIVVNIIHQSLNGWWIFLFLPDKNKKRVTMPDYKATLINQYI